MTNKITCTSCGFDSTKFPFTATKIKIDPLLAKESLDQPGIKCGFCGNVMLYRDYKDQIPEQEKSTTEEISAMENEGNIQPAKVVGEPEETVNKDADPNEYGWYDMDGGSSIPIDYPFTD